MLSLRVTFAVVLTLSYRQTKMMTAEGKGTPSIVGTAKDLLKHQGVGGFYRGIDSNILRAMVLNGTKMACYDQTKGYVVQYTGLAKTSLVTQFVSAVAAGFFMTCTVSPFDMVRTRLMNQPADAKSEWTETPLYISFCSRSDFLTIASSLCQCRRLLRQDNKK